jgi:hypothetical protein
MEQITPGSVVRKEKMMQCGQAAVNAAVGHRKEDERCL